MTRLDHLKVFYENGLSHESFISDVLSVNYNGQYKIQETLSLPDADIAVYGPYGKKFPSEGSHIKVAYICENWIPDSLDVDYLFGVKPYKEVKKFLPKHTKYFQIRWHGVNPNLLEPKKDNRLLEWRERPCNFLYLYTAPCFYRERICKYLLQRFDINCPGESLNNIHISSLSPRFAGDERSSKLALLRDYKFVFAFENYISNGYQTEKLYDAFQAGCIPVYIGDPTIDKIFNKKAMLALSPKNWLWALLLKLGQIGDLRYGEILRSSSPLPRLRWKIRCAIRRFFLLAYTMFMARRIEYEISALYSNPKALSEILQATTFCEGVDPRVYLNGAAWEEIFHNASLRKKDKQL